jgi:hypothetical protein
MESRRFSRAGSVELAKFGAFAIAECIKKDMSYDTISAVSARSKFKIYCRKYGKGQSKKCVAEFVKNLGIDLTNVKMSTNINRLEQSPSSYELEMDLSSKKSKLEKKYLDIVYKESNILLKIIKMIYG